MLSAQTTFVPATRAVDIQSYTWVEQCLAASERVRDSVESWGPILYDTLAWRLPGAIPTAVATARNCSAHFPAASAPLKDFTSLLQLYQLAEQRSEVATLLNRKLASIAPTAVQERYYLLGTAAYNTLQFGPEWFSVAESLHVERMRLVDDPRLSSAYKDSVFIRSISFYTSLRTLAGEYRDSSWISRAAQKVIALAEHAAPVDLSSTYYTKYGKYYVFNALDDAKKSVLFDSLGKSTAAYIALQRANWVAANKDSSSEIAIPFGVSAPPITGAFHFGIDASAPPRPTRGKVSLILFLDDFKMGTKSLSPQSWCTPACFDALATTKRLVQRFPELEVTLVARTRGFFRQGAPPPPAEEATWLQRFLLEYQNVPAGLVVEQTDFWRLDAPDLRRIDNKTSTFASYSRLGGALGVTPFMMFLTDETGTIVDVSWSVGMFGGITPSRLDRNKEARVAALIEILLNRQKSVSNATGQHPTTP